MLKPAFWLLPDPLGWPPEIDVLEVLGHEPDKIYLTHHFRDDQRKHASSGGSWKGPDFSANFHEFAVEWSPEQIVWFVDGQERFRSKKTIPRVKMYMLVNLAVGGDWPGAPDEKTQFPAAFEVDYVRVYDTAPISTPSFLSLQRVGNSLLLAWSNGVLQSSSNLAGPWLDHSEVSSPYSVSPLAPSQFYRVRMP